MDVFAFGPGQWLLMAFVAWIAFTLGRKSAGSGESSEARQMRVMQEDQAAAESFAGLSPDKQAEIDRLLLANQKIAAIKVIREATGKALKESKQIADRRQKEIAP